MSSTEAKAETVASAMPMSTNVESNNMEDTTSDGQDDSKKIKSMDKREHEILKKKSDLKEENKTKENKVKSIDSSNKGFAMLAKMGYKTGESLGKSNSGRIEPIPIEVKNDRGGLGKIILTLNTQCFNIRIILIYSKEAFWLF